MPSDAMREVLDRHFPLDRPAVKQTTGAPPKPSKAFTTRKGPTARSRAKRKAAESPVIKVVREQCERRDGYCRIAKAPAAIVGECSGPSEWAHEGEKKRARTRGQAPEVRHDRRHSFMACQRHHRLYDAGEITVTPRTKRGCDGPLTLTTASGTYQEAA
jgi:hypothetical protein